MTLAECGVVGAQRLLFYFSTYPGIRRTHREVLSGRGVTPGRYSEAREGGREVPSHSMALTLGVDGAHTCTTLWGGQLCVFGQGGRWWVGGTRGASSGQGR